MGIKPSRRRRGTDAEIFLTEFAFPFFRATAVEVRRNRLFSFVFSVSSCETTLMKSAYELAMERLEKKAPPGPAGGMAPGEWDEGTSRS